MPCTPSLSGRNWWLVILAASFLLLACIPLGVLLRGKLRSDSRKNELEVGFEDEEDDDDDVDHGPVNLLEELCCIDIGRTFRGFWDCLVEGLPGKPKEPPSRDPAVIRMKKLNVSKYGNSTKRSRVKREEIRAKPYAPLDPEVIFTLTPLSHKCELIYHFPSTISIPPA